jgi:asparagine N-glycosylation enzyme membrane subunit Stt3
MAISFDPLLLLVWIALICFIPGSILSFSLFRNSKYLWFEKLLIGFGLGLIILPAIPFLLYFLAGIKFSYGIALFSVALFYAISIAFLVRSKAYEGIKIPAFTIDKNLGIALVVALLLLITFWIRILPYSPIFFELDPYYYTDIAQQILTMGGNPVNDQTAWYPDVVVSHRIAPILGYLEASWYTFYNGGTSYDNFLLAVIASIYPPIVAALSVFFIYLFVSTNYRREWGILAAGIASFVPIFLFKTTAGEMELQPFAFFALAFFLAMYAAMIKENKKLLAALTGLAYMSIALGSASEIVALMVLVLFVALQSIYFYIREDNESLKELIMNNGIVFAIGPALSGGIVKGLFYNNSINFFYPLMFFLALLFAGFLYTLRQRVADKFILKLALPAMIVIGLLVYFLTPVGGFVKGFASSTVSVAQYNSPLDRTIAEQHPAAPDLSGSLGSIAMAPSGIVLFFSNRIISTMGSGSIGDFIGWAGVTLGGVLDAIIYPISIIVNLGLSISVLVLNWFIGTNIDFAGKSNSLLLFWFAAVLVAFFYSLYRSKNEKTTLALLFAAAIFPPFLIGIIKAKFTIYSGFLLAAGIGLVFGEAEDFIKKFMSNLSSTFYYTLLALAILVVLLQFVVSSGGFAPPVLSQSFKTRFQDDPAAFQEKFQSICNNFTSSGVSEQSICSQYSAAGFQICSTYDTSICTVAADPVAYANKGTNEQYNSKLCYYSLIDDITIPKTEEIVSANYRCKRLSTYWIEAMEWIKQSTSKDSRFTSWWDYGHWTNFFGQRNSVLRNEHASHYMIGEVAYIYLDGTPAELASFMRSRNSSYAIFDAELVGSAYSMGGKYGALNYLMCARNNQTNVSFQPSLSVCEANHLWETIIVPRDPTGRECTISKTGNKTGVLAYTASWTYSNTEEFRYTPFYPGTPIANCYGTNLNNPNTLAFCQNLVKVSPAYCLGDVLLANGQKTVGTYYLNQTYANGDLKQNKAQIVPGSQYSETLHLGDVMSANLFYTKTPLFLESGNITDGYDDRSMKFYSSNLYRAIFLDEIPGFTKVFETKDQMVKIFKLNE